MSASILPPRKRDWTPGTTQIGVFLRMPDGATVACVRKRASRKDAQAVMNVALGVLGVPAPLPDAVLRVRVLEELCNRLKNVLALGADAARLEGRPEEATEDLIFEAENVLAQKDTVSWDAVNTSPETSSKEG